MKDQFELVSPYQPQGDQPKAIEKIVKGIKEGKQHQVLLGATGTGKTFTMSNVIKEINKPTLIMAHNKTLAGQLYSEFKEFFLIMQSNTLSVTMITISLKLMYLKQIHLLKKMQALMTRLINFVTQQLLLFLNEKMSLLLPAYPVFMD